VAAAEAVVDGLMELLGEDHERVAKARGKIAKVSS
jgi:hypothetical protein